MANADTVAEVGKKFQTLGSLMDERIRRLWAACEAAALGRGGVTAVAEATGMSRTTIRAGIVELQDPQGRREAEPAGRQTDLPPASEQSFAELPEFASVMGWIGRSASVYRLLVRQRNPQRIEDFCLAGVGNRQPCDAGLLIHSIFQ